LPERISAHRVDLRIGTIAGADIRQTGRWIMIRKTLEATPPEASMAHRRRHTTRVSATLETLAYSVTRWTGSSWGFGAAIAVIAAWAITGPVFGFSDTWQLVINTGTTIVTFLMVFLIQRTQNKESQAIHLKLNEIVAALQGASNRLINVEDLTEDEVQTLHRHYARLAAMAKRESDLGQSHSVEEAEARHHRKRPAATSGPGGPPGC
jgi:low affinity Fe/Cu permease